MTNVVQLLHQDPQNHRVDENAKLQRVLTSHQQDKIKLIRADAKVMVLTIMAHCPPSTDRSEAVRKLRECVMMATCSVALASV